MMKMNFKTNIKMIINKMRAIIMRMMQRRIMILISIKTMIRMLIQINIKRKKKIKIVIIMIIKKTILYNSFK